MSGEAILSDCPKTVNGNRMIEISKDIEKILLPVIRECKERNKGENIGDCLLFRAKNGDLVTTSQVNCEFKRFLDKYRILDESNNPLGKITLHSLRHTFATRMIEAGVDAFALKDILGHSDIQMTLNTYCDSFAEYRNKNLKKGTEYLDELGIRVN